LHHTTSTLICSLSLHDALPILAATRHPIYEHARVNSFAAILKNWRDDEQARKLGRLMYESHESYSRCGLGSDGTDALVTLVRETDRKSTRLNSSHVAISYAVFC